MDKPSESETVASRSTNTVRTEPDEARIKAECARLLGLLQSAPDLAAVEQIIDQLKALGKEAKDAGISIPDIKDAIDSASIRKAEIVNAAVVNNAAKEEQDKQERAEALQRGAVKA